MSEFQYYEFQAIDRPLDAEAQRALRQISTRARITPHSLVNTYQWGDFKGAPRELVKRWFDLFIYWANWGSRRLLIRLPRRAVDPAAIRPYCVRTLLQVEVAREFVIVEVQRTIEDPPDEFPDEETGVSVPFAALRADLLRSDLSCLYLGWLLGVQDGLVTGKTPEPPRPTGLLSPSGALYGFASFFGLDPDLLAVVAEGEAGAATIRRAPAPDELARVIADLSEAEKTALLRRAALEGDPHVLPEIRRRWLTTRDQSGPDNRVRRGWDAQELLNKAKARARERVRLEAEREAAERARRAERERVERERRLARLAGHEDGAWEEVDTLARTKRPADYDRAVALLKDLKALADRDGRSSDFNRRVQQLREGHRRKLGLLERLRSAGV